MITLTTAAPTAVIKLFPGHQYLLEAIGTFGSGTLTLERTFNNSTYYALTDTAITVSTIAKVITAGPGDYRLNLTDSTAASITVYLTPVK